MINSTRLPGLFYITLVLNLLNGPALKACTIFFGADSQRVLAAANKSHDNLATQFAVYADEEGKFDRIYLGRRVPQGFQNAGGMNEHGLWYDGADLPERNDIANHYNKPSIQGELCEFTLEKCKTLAEVRTMYETYYSPHWQGHSMWGDATGKSMIIEYSNNDVVFLDDEQSFQVMTNFYLQDTENQKWKHCYRYSTATQMLLDAQGEYTPTLFRSILDETHQVGIPPTLLSAIYDLKARKISLYRFYNYDESIVLDVDTLLEKGSRKYDIPELFSGIALDSPENGELVDSDAVLLEWRGEASDYQVLLSIDPDFEDVLFYTAVDINDSSTRSLALLSIFLPFSLLSIPKRYSLLMRKMLVLLILTPLMFSCLNPLFSPYESSNQEHELLIENLDASTTYYWKIQTEVQSGIVNESLIRSFQVE